MSSEFKALLDAGSVDGAAARMAGRTWDSSYGIQAQAAVIVLATRDLERTARELDHAAQRLQWAALAIGVASVFVAVAGVLVAWLAT